MRKYLLVLFTVIGVSALSQVVPKFGSNKLVQRTSGNLEVRLDSIFLKGFVKMFNDTVTYQKGFYHYNSLGQLVSVIAQQSDGTKFHNRQLDSAIYKVGTDQFIHRIYLWNKTNNNWFLFSEKTTDIIVSNKGLIEKKTTNFLSGGRRENVYEYDAYNRKTYFGSFYADSGSSELILEVEEYFSYAQEPNSTIINPSTRIFYDDLGNVEKEEITVGKDSVDKNLNIVMSFRGDSSFPEEGSLTTFDYNAEGNWIKVNGFEYDSDTQLWIEEENSELDYYNDYSISNTIEMLKIMSFDHEITGIVEFMNNKPLKTFSFNFWDAENSVWTQGGVYNFYYSKPTLVSLNEANDIKHEFYPTIVSDVVSVGFENKSAQLNIMNDKGQVVYSQVVDKLSVLNFSDFPTGNYFYRLTSGELVRNGKFIVK